MASNSPIDDFLIKIAIVAFLLCFPVAYFVMKTIYAVPTETELKNLSACAKSKVLTRTEGEMRPMLAIDIASIKRECELQQQYADARKAALIQRQQITGSSHASGQTK